MMHSTIHHKQEVIANERELTRMKKLAAIRVD